MAVVPSPSVRVAVAESLIRDLCRVSEWCDLCGTQLNPEYNLTIGGTVKKSSDLVILGVTFVSKMTFEK